jgi:dihydroorotate dehydrogenase
LPIELARDDFQALIDVILSYDIQGVILGNLKKKRDDSILEDNIDHLKGGISGLPMQPIVRELVSKTYAYAGDKLTIVGVGGVFSPEDAYELIKRGASLVQLITGMIFQ